MKRCDVSRLIVGTIAALICGIDASAVSAQITRGFDTTADAVANGEERQRQPDLHVFEVQFKPVRMQFADVTDPKSGETNREQIWYLCYRAINRSLATREDDTDTTPVNVLDPLPGPIPLIPEFSLLTYDQPGAEIPDREYLDQIIPQAVAVVNQVERRRPSDPVFKDSVAAVQPLPEPVPIDQTDVDWIYGVATWSDVDPETDFFKVIMRGFSNGYELRPGPDGKMVTWRKALVQEFTRRGDRFDPNQIEFEVVGSPQWVYLPDRAPADATPPSDK